MKAATVFSSLQMQRCHPTRGTVEAANSMIYFPTEHLSPHGGPLVDGLLQRLVHALPSSQAS